LGLFCFKAKKNPTWIVQKLVGFEVSTLDGRKLAT
jgi:hypothetical protein